MKEFYKNISDALAMLDGLEQDLNIRHLTPMNLKSFIQSLFVLTIITMAPIFQI